LDANVACTAPMFATYAIKQRVERKMFLSDQVVIDPPFPTEGYGVFEAYICRQCGFVDWYCQDPGKIPIGPEYMTEEFNADSAEPYR